MYLGSVRQLVQQLLVRAPVVHLTSDLQSNQGAKHAYLFLAGHWWEVEASDIEQHARAGYRWTWLNVAVMEGSRPAHKSPGALREMLQPWSLATERQGLFVT